MLALVRGTSRTLPLRASPGINTRSRRLASQLPPRIKIKDEDIEESFLKGSGPGGQKINKTASAVQLKHLPTGFVVKSQATRSRSQNREIARRLLADKIEHVEKGEESRVALKAQMKKRKKASKTKKARRKYRKLEEEDGGDVVRNGDGGEGGSASGAQQKDYRDSDNAKNTKDL